VSLTSNPSGWDLNFQFSKQVVNLVRSPSTYLPDLNLKTFLMGICNVKACYHVAYVQWVLKLGHVTMLPCCICAMGSKIRACYHVTMLHMCNGF
jgi:hypothetical protein